MKTAKLGALFLVLIMAITAVGASYAHWEETIQIEGVLSTDTIDPQFYCPDSNDDPADEFEYRLDPVDCGYWDDLEWFGCRKNKDVGWMTVQDSADHKELTITIGDAYPCYYANAFFCLRNKGTCPVQVYGITLERVSGEGHEFWLDEPLDLEVCSWYLVEIFKPGPGIPWTYRVVKYDGSQDPDNFDFAIHVSGPNIGEQLDPYQWSKPEEPKHADIEVTEIYGDICVHFENSCEQGENYDFKIGLTFWNWPEVVI